LKDQEKIDLRFLDSLKKEMFRSRIPKLAHWYDAALDAFKDKDQLPYEPRVFVLPFYECIKSRINGGTKILRRIGLTSIDPDDPYNKWAIYVPFSVVKNAPKAINIANLAHEIVHFNLRAKGTELLTTEQILQAAKEGKSLIQMNEMKEREVSNLESMFEEPVQTMIVKMEKEQKVNSAIATKYLEGTTEATEDMFFNTILGTNAERFHEEHFRRMKERLGMDD